MSFNHKKLAMTNPSHHALPSITDLIREEHAQVVDTFHQYSANLSAPAKQKLVSTVSRTLDHLSQLKSDIFYPALRALGTATTDLARSESEQHEIHSLIGQLRDMRPTATHYDDTVSALWDLFSRHTAAEEAALLPLAERSLADQLGELGARMRTRRVVLSSPSLGQVSAALLAAGGLVAGGYLIKRALDHRRA